MYQAQHQEHYPQMKNQPVFIPTPLSEVLTPSTCTKIISEIIKYVVYQKQQIPYTYEHMKHIASACKNVCSSSPIPQSPTSGAATSNQRKARIMEGRQNKVAIQSFEAFETIFKNLEVELQTNGSCGVKEVVLVMGSTPMSPREVYRIQLPSLIPDHCERPNKHRQNLLQLIRCLAASADLNDILCRPMAPTNTYVYLKMNKSGQKSEWFLPKDRYTLPPRGQHVIISVTRRETELASSHENHACVAAPSVDIPLKSSCEFLVHQDSTEMSNDEVIPAKKVHLLGALEESNLSSMLIESSNLVLVVPSTNIQWYQSRLVLKGFKS